MSAASGTVKVGGLRARVAKAGAWILIGYAGSQIIRLCTNVVLARLLSPDVFGLMSVVYILMVGMALFSDLGINRSVVQSPRGHDPELLDTAWTMQVIRGVGLGAVSVVLAGLIALAAQWGWSSAKTVYGDPRLPWIVATFSVVAILAGFESIRVGLARREMKVKLLTKIDLGNQIVTSIVMVAIGWLFHSIWALVIGAVFNGALRCGLGHWILPGHREKLRLVRDAMAELLASGKWVFLSSILGFVSINGDRLLLGTMIDARSFGLYTVAFMLVNVLQMVAATFCMDVAYPAVAEVYRERPHDLSRTLQKFQWGYDGLVTFIASIMISAGPALIHLLYDARYQDAGWIMSALAIGAIGMRYQLIEQSYQATGAPKYMTLANLIRLVALALGILVGQHFWGTVGAIGGIALSQYAAWPLVWWYKAQHKALTWQSELMLLPAVAAGWTVGWLIAELLAWLPPLHFHH